MTESDLQSRITGANIRWHCRSTTRKWDGDQKPPFGTEFVVVSREDEEADGTMFAISLQTTNTEKRGYPTVRVRAAVQLVDERMVGLQDCEVQFHLANDTTEPTEDELRELLHGWGVEYVMGYLRGALADGARSVGLPAPVLPTMNHMALDDLDVESMIQSAVSSDTD